MALISSKDAKSEKKLMKMRAYIKYCLVYDLISVLVIAGLVLLLAML